MVGSSGSGRLGAASERRRRRLARRDRRGAPGTAGSATTSGSSGASISITSGSRGARRQRVDRRADRRRPARHPLQCRARVDEQQPAMITASRRSCARERAEPRPAAVARHGSGATQNRIVVAVRAAAGATLERIVERRRPGSVRKPAGPRHSRAGPSSCTRAGSSWSGEQDVLGGHAVRRDRACGGTIAGSDRIGPRNSRSSTGLSQGAHLRVPRQKLVRRRHANAARGPDLTRSTEQVRREWVLA
jgi:hypothetical protein